MKRVQPKGKEGVEEEDPQQAEVLNEKALEVITRVSKKLTGLLLLVVFVLFVVVCCSNFKN